MLSLAEVEVLGKEHEDALGAIEDARGELKEERHAVEIVEIVHDAALEEAAHLRAKVEGMGRSLSPFLLLPHLILG